MRRCGRSFGFFHGAELRNRGLLDGDAAGEVLVTVQEGVQGVVDYGALGVGWGGGGVRGHDVFTRTHI